MIEKQQVDGKGGRRRRRGAPLALSVVALWFQALVPHVSSKEPSVCTPGSSIALSSGILARVYRSPSRLSLCSFVVSLIRGK